MRRLRATRRWPTTVRDSDVCELPFHRVTCGICGRRSRPVLLGTLVMVPLHKMLGGECGGGWKPGRILRDVRTAEVMAVSLGFGIVALPAA